MVRSCLCLHATLIVHCLLPWIVHKNKYVLTKLHIKRRDLQSSYNNSSVYKYQLENGLTILVYPLATAVKVSTQLWYHVGSKDERSGEKGLAHFLEHMLFKGTERMTESDINVFSHKLSGYCNAFTSYDTTMYLFDMPLQHWQEVLPVFADCMQHAKLEQEHLNSELKAVIQELKMYKDEYSGHLFDELVSTIFADHPYHYPIIGFKHDLWSLEREALLQFYHTHYIPNNATLVVVGNVSPDDVYRDIDAVFGDLKGNPDYKKRTFYHQDDIIAKSITLNRFIENPSALCTWVIPGLKAKQEYVATMVSWLLAQGRGSRLYRLLVDDLQLVVDVQSHIHNFFDYGLFSLEFQLKNVSDFDRVKQLVMEAIADLAEHGWTEKEECRARKRIEIDYVNLFECPQKLGMALGETYLATGDEQHILQFLQDVPDDISTAVKDFVKTFLRQTVMHTGLLIPININEQDRLDQIQHDSDTIDSLVLQKKVRSAPVEPSRYANLIMPKSPPLFHAPRAQTVMLSNGLKVVHACDNRLPTIEIMLDLKTKYYGDPSDLQGLSLCTSYMVGEGTSNYSAYELAMELESHGIHLSIDPGSITITLLKDDLEKGLELLNELLTKAVLPEPSLMKIKDRMLSDIESYWDEPSEFIDDLIRKEVYRGHPYSRQILGTSDSISRISHDDVRHWYTATYTPREATLVIVGDTERYDVVSMLEERLGMWRGVVPPVIAYPSLSSIHAHELTRFIKRDQTVVCFAGLSVPRIHPDFDKLLLFDQIFGGGVLNSMNSRLFLLREQSGLFYTIKGSLIAGSDEQPGMVLIKTLVSNDSLKQAVESIRETIDTAINHVTDEEFEQAKYILNNALIESFSTHQQTAASLLFLVRYRLDATYFDTRTDILKAISKNDMITTVRKYLSSDKLLCIQVGRV